MRKGKLNKVLIVIVFFLSFVAIIISIIGFKNIEAKILFLDKQLQENHSELMNESIDNDYPFSIYLKDLIVNIGTYKDATIILFVILLVMMFIVFIKKI